MEILQCMTITSEERLEVLEHVGVRWKSEGTTEDERLQPNA